MVGIRRFEGEMYGKSREEVTLMFRVEFVLTVTLCFVYFSTFLMDVVRFRMKVK